MSGEGEARGTRPPRAEPVPAAPRPDAARGRRLLRILGLDPGSRVAGYGLLESDGRRSRRLASGCIRPRGEGPAEVLASLQRELAGLLGAWLPDVVAVEAVFHQRNVRSALVLGQARGALLAGCGLAGVATAEYAPAQVKQAVTGSGAADKEQVARMVRLILGLAAEPLVADESDALAVALCHAQTLRLSAAIEHGERRLEGVRGDKPSRAPAPTPRAELP
jgi:crossover junction endodeoxyribonuclease RuvC